MGINTTKIIHSLPVDPLTGSISVPIYQTATFVQDAPGVHKGYDYARSNNPTRAALESLVATLEGGTHAYAFATGLAAIDAVLKLLTAGDEIIAVDDIYGGAYRLFTHVYAKFGIKVHYVDTTDAENVIELINEKTRFIWLESPTNPTLKVSDIQRIADIAKPFNALVVVDNTFASPVAQQPFTLGADIIIHSGTKYLGGHSDLVAGLVVVNDNELAEKVKFIQNASGGILGPNDCWLLIRGIETLTLRVQRQCETAQKVAEFLAENEAVDKVYYPGLASHKNHEIAKVQQNGLYGGVISFTLKEDTEAAANVLVTNTQYFKLAESLGGVKSLICSPPQMTHKSIPREKRLQSGVVDSLIRISCGIEDAEDLIDDLKTAIDQVVAATATNLVGQGAV
ncbi:PLP-dependent aspartate aminotransferase family protein [Taibaiella sp. KBW10]|uniref:trans-sulfuration enzyme family protein n=1 Tax=Taibaiella sp. KBW10 TaxID=2153357 RepID=UPI0018F48587|nr:PLP-dependent aspartate aminotransferase family protein [Taibaiella sp. KBW10]